jgi:hypothetical protein
MMTSALLTMMDRHEGPAEGSMHRSPSRGSYSNETRGNLKDDTTYSHSEPNLERMSPMRPPPGMMMNPQGMSNNFSSNAGQELTRERSPSLGGYFVGGYDPAPPRSPPWGG